MCKKIERPKIYFKDSYFFCNLYVKPHEMYSRNYNMKENKVANHMTTDFVTSILLVTIAT